MSAFWQNRHLKLQPTVAMEKDRLPGIRWKIGFFSMGSSPAAIRRP
jgi:hypothetical protein